MADIDRDFVQLYEYAIWYKVVNSNQYIHGPKDVEDLLGQLKQLLKMYEELMKQEMRRRQDETQLLD